MYLHQKNCCKIREVVDSHHDEQPRVASNKENAVCRLWDWSACLIAL
jgi:hypothetical protein